MMASHPHEADSAVDLLAVLRQLRPPRLSARQWRRLLDQARQCRLSGLLAARVADRGWGTDLPEGVRVYLDNVRKTVHRKQLDTRWEADRLLHALSELKVPLVLLKGAAYVMAGLPAASGRNFSDVDLLVPRTALRAAELALLRHGWVAETLDPYDERYYRDWTHELPPLVHVERMTHLDLHHAITQPTSRYAVPTDQLLSACKPIPGHPGLFVLSPVDRVVHCAVHAMQDGDFGGGLRDLFDLSLLIEQGVIDDPDFPDKLVVRVRQLGLEIPVHDALSLARDLVDARVAAGVAGELSPAWHGRLRRRVVQGLLRRAMLPTDRRGDRLAQRAAAFVLYVRSHALRMPWHQLLPHLVHKAWRRARARLGHRDPDLPARLPMAR